ncbi:hypothetical protein JX266_014112 [Neoarthrinium moseri]|nr:hypothetical protein JX266_014112 [Neoarthrinium moseri]
MAHHDVRRITAHHEGIVGTSSNTTILCLWIGFVSKRDRSVASTMDRLQRPSSLAGTRDSTSMTPVGLHINKANPQNHTLDSTSTRESQPLTRPPAEARRSAVD